MSEYERLAAAEGLLPCGCQPSALDRLTAECEKRGEGLHYWPPGTLMETHVIRLDLAATRRKDTFNGATIEEAAAAALAALESGAT